jgi:hypothetical protein
MRQRREGFIPSSSRPAGNRTRKGVPQTKSAHRSPNKIHGMPQMRSCFSKSSGRRMSRQPLSLTKKRISLFPLPQEKTPDRRVCADTGFFYIPAFVERSKS